MLKSTRYQKFVLLSLLIITNVSYGFETQDPKVQLNGYVFQVLKKNGNPYKDLEKFITAVKNQKDTFPAEYKEQVVKFKNDNSRSYLLLKGLPVEKDLSPTPGAVFYANEKNSYTSEVLLTSVAVILGEPFNYIQEENGNIFRNIRPTKINQTQQTSDSSKVDLELHTETAFHSFKPDFLMLYCLRSDRDKQAFTIIAKLDDVIDELKNDKDVIETLRKPLYATGIDVSFGNTDKELSSFNLPILYTSQEEGNLMITYDLDLMKATTEESQEAFIVLTKAIKKVQKKILLEPGDMLIFDNRRVIHGRTAFKPYFDGADRWLQRVYVSKNEEFIKNINDSNRIIKSVS